MKFKVHFILAFILFVFFLSSYDAFFLNAAIKEGKKNGVAQDPFIRGDVFKSYCDHVYDDQSLLFNPKKVRPYDAIFVKTDHDLLGFFFTVYHRQIKCPYILVTHNSDHNVPGPFFRYLDDPKIVAWFGQNVENFSHPKLIPIPIGIANKGWSHGKADTFLNAMNDIGKIERSICLYMNIAISTHPERACVYDLFKEKSYCVISQPKGHADYLNDLLASKFVLSPRGNGLDCHRTWEALLMGAFPIVRSSSLDPMFKDLPVVIIDEWEEVNERFLKAKYEELTAKEYNRDKLFAGYWLNLIKSYQAR